MQFGSNIDANLKQLRYNVDANFFNPSPQGLNYYSSFIMIVTKVFSSNFMMPSQLCANCMDASILYLYFLELVRIYKLVF